MIAPDPAAVVLRGSTYRRTRWKNGGGETMDIAISPAGSTLDNFDWRISMATVASDGPFSTFPGIDRTLCILDGAGIALQVGDGPVQRLDASSAPFSFPGDAPAHSKLTGGAVTDFNVMTRRGRLTHTVERIHLRPGEHHTVQPDVRVLFCQWGFVSIETATGREQLEARDAIVRYVSDGAAWSLAADTTATVCLVTISANATCATRTHAR